MAKRKAKNTTRNGVSILSYGLLVTVVTHILTHVFTRIHPAIFPIIRKEFNFSLQQLGVIASIPRLAQALLAIPAGLFSDRFGSKRMIIVSFFVACLGILVASQTYSYVALILAIIFVSINTTVYHPASYRLITRFRSRNRLRALAIHEACGTFGVAIGPVSVSILMGFLALKWRQVYLFWLVPVLLGVIAVSKIRSDFTADADKDTAIESSDSLFTLTLVMFLFFVGVRMVAGQMVDTFIPIYLVDEKGVSEVRASLIFGIGAMMRVVGTPVGGLLASRFGEKRWLLTALTLTYASLGLAVAIPSNVAFIGLYLSYSFCSTLSMTANSAIMAKLSPSRRRGLGYALFFLPGSIVGAVAPLISAYIAEAFGLTSIFLVALIVYIFGQSILKFGVKV